MGVELAQRKSTGEEAESFWLARSQDPVGPMELVWVGTEWLSWTLRVGGRSSFSPTKLSMGWKGLLVA